MCEPAAGSSNIAMPGDVAAHQHFGAGNVCVGFGSGSPLEPLDPTKFRNIMVEKHEATGFGHFELAKGVKESVGSFRNTMTAEGELNVAQSESDQQQRASGTFVHPRFPPANATPAFHQINSQQLRESQQQSYFIQQNIQSHYGPMQSPSSASLYGVGGQQMGYLVHGDASSVQPSWNQPQQAQQKPQYVSSQLCQLSSRMLSPQQQQFGIAKPQPSQLTSYPAESGQHTISYPSPHPLHQSSPPIGNVPKQELQHQYQQQILPQQQQQTPRFAAAYSPHQLLSSRPSPAAFHMSSNCGVTNAAMDLRHYMNLTSGVSHTVAVPGSTTHNDQSVQQQSGAQPIKKAQSMFFNASSEMAHQQHIGGGNPTNVTFPSPPATFVRPSPSQDFGGVQHHNKHQQQMLRLPSSQQPSHAHFLQIPSQPQFFGHEPNLAATLNPDICLAGCVFLLVDDCDPHLVDFSLLPSIIRLYGGDIESNNPRGIPERVTHVVCSNWIENEALIQQALTPSFIDRMPRKLKRVVTLNWLNDAIAKRQVTAPSKACHLPSVWSSTRHNPKTFSKVIAAHGFSKRELLELKYMKSDFLVVTKSVFGEQLCQLAARTGSVLVNFQWLLELYFGCINCFTSASSCSPLALSKVCEMCHKLMVPWSQSTIPLHEEIIRLAHQSRENLMSDVTLFPEKHFKISNIAPTDKQIEEATVLYAKSGREVKFVLLFDGLFPEQIENLSRKARFLGAEITSLVALCTHFVTTSLHRTVNLLEAIALGKSVVTPLWVETSLRRLGFVQDLSFFVRDRENEKKYGFNLKATTLRTRNRRVFKGVTFHLSVGVQPKYEVIRRLIEAGGGIVQKEKPKGRDLLQYIQEDRTLFVICDRNSLSSYQFLIDWRFPIFNEDFVLMSILRHKIDISEEFHASPISHCQVPST
uniref:PAX-interacting protein 1 n=1 Tax=Globodera rostochiensis TaxID=31243 RepID=A0A914HEE6_GLORO